VSQVCAERGDVFATGADTRANGDVQENKSACPTMLRDGTRSHWQA